MEETKIDTQKITDLELADFITQQLTQLFQLQQNINALQAELNRRKQLIEKSHKEIK